MGNIFKLVDNQSEFLKACGNGELDMVASSDIDIRMNNNLPMVLACENGHLHVIEWFNSNGIDIGTEIEIRQEAFRNACKYGHLHIIEWIWNLESYEINLQEAFQIACENGHLPIVRWLYNKSVELNSPINIHAENEYVFQCACWESHLPVVKWLYDKSVELGSPINIHVEKDSVFEMACYSKSFKIVKWLYNKSVELENPIAINDYVFESSRQVALFFLKKENVVNVKLTTPLLKIWNAGIHAVQITRKNPHLFPILNENIVKYI